MIRVASAARLREAPCQGVSLQVGLGLTRVSAWRLAVLHPYHCVLVAILLPYVWVSLAKLSPHMNNRDPRGYLASVTGWRQRAYYAQLNAFESLQIFGISVLIYGQRHEHFGPLARQVCMIYLACRVFHGLCYLYDLDKLRSLMWLASFLAATSLIVI